MCLLTLVGTLFKTNNSQLTSLQTILHEHFAMTQALSTKIRKALLLNSWTIILMT